MTREDAIDILDEVKEIDDSMYQYNEAYMSALEMAIKSLEAWDEVIGHLQTTANELLERKDEKHSHFFAKGITFAVSMIIGTLENSRILMQASKPSISGIIRSRMIRSGI